MQLVGIDLGLKGGIVCIDEAGRLMSWCIMPTKLSTRGKPDIDVCELSVFFDKLFDCGHIDLVMMEYVHSFGQEARSALFSFGRGTGKVQALLELRGLAYEEVTPQEWKADVLKGTDKSKKAAIGWATNRHPGVGLPKNHDGMADACGIAEHARRKLLRGVK